MYGNDIDLERERGLNFLKKIKKMENNVLRVLQSFQFSEKPNTQ